MKNPSGMCMCGCGANTPRVGTKPRRYLMNHDKRRGRANLDGYQVDPVTGCWVWALGLTGLGYGKTGGDGKTLLAHRVMYERERGPIPAGLQLDHLCRNRACVNPDHLEPVTAAENTRRGSQTKLTAAEVRAIRASNIPRRELAQRFGVTHRTISEIWRGVTWKGI